MRYAVNHRLLVGTIVLLAVLAPAAYALHAYQVQRNAAMLLAYAQRAQKNAESLQAKNATRDEIRQQWMTAADYFQRYAKLRPEDLTGRIGVAKCRDRLALTPRQKNLASELYTQALGLAPDNLELRGRNAELLLELGALQRADAEAARVLAAQPHNTACLRVRALVAYNGARAEGRQADWTKVADSFENALAQQPADIQLALGLADLYRRILGENQPAEYATRADAVIDRMVRAAPDRPDVLVARCRYRIRFSLPGADDDLDHALQLAPRDPGVLFAAGERARRAGKLEDARQYFEQLVEVSPYDRDGYINLGKVLVAAGALDEAQRLWERGLEKVGRDDAALNLEAAVSLLAAGRLSEAESRLIKLTAIARGLAPRLPQVERTKLAATLDYLQGYLHTARGRYLEAVPLLERVLVTFQGAEPGSVEATRRIQVLSRLGLCYSELEQWDRAAAAYQEAATLEPDSTELVLATAKVWARANRFDLARERYEQAGQYGLPADEWVFWAFTRLRQQLELPAAERDVTACRTILSEAKAKAPQSARLKLLEAEFEATVDNLDEAIKLADAAAKEHPTDPELWRFLCVAYQTWGESARAEEALAHFQTLPGITPSEVLRAQVDVAQRRPEFAEVERLLRLGLETGEHADQIQAGSLLADFLIERGRRDEAVQVLDSLGARFSDDTALLRRLADLAWEARDLKQLEHCEVRLQKLEGPSGTWWRYLRARRLMEQAKSPSDPGFLEAVKLAAELDAQRPNWSGTYVLKGEIARYQNRTVDAIAAYEHALHYGEQNYSVLTTLLVLLYGERRYAEAEKWLAEYGRPLAQSQDLSRLAISLSLERGQHTEAVRLAREAVAQWPDDAMQKVWLGQALALAGNRSEAEEQLRSAVRQAPDDFRTWAGLLTFLVRNNQVDDARGVLQRLADDDRPMVAQRALVLGQGFQLLGDLGQAYKYFQRAAQLGVSDASIQVQAARFFVQADPGQAEVCLRQALALSPAESEARQLLARLLTSRGGQSSWQEVKKLVGNPGGPVAERRTWVALLLARGGLENRNLATRMLEELARDSRDALPSDRRLLAMLFESEGRIERAKEHLRVLADRDDAEPEQLVDYAAFLLRQKLNDEAAPWIARLERKDPDNFSVVALRATWLKQVDRPGEIPGLIEGYRDRQLQRSSSPPAQSEIWTRVGDLYAGLELDVPAESAYREALKLDSTQYRPLAAWLAAHQCHREAIELCDGPLKLDENLPHFMFLASLLGTGQPSAEDYAAAEPLIDRALRQHRRRPDVLHAVATLRYLAGRDDEAIALYREALDLSPDRALTLNNLGMLLGERSDHYQEALTCVQKAIDLAGPRTDFLDSLGMVYLAQDRVNDALRVLKDATADPAADSRSFFHLAVAYQRTSAKREAREALARAEAKDFDKQPLSKHERQLLSELKRDLRQ
ncbi:MAG: tetratricopeptide repeat protein [Pirellulales bacterium]|nr:tetratricopeptide repeat protein [Pirellulales bacterium]